MSFIKNQVKNVIATCARIAVIGARKEIQSILQEALHNDARDLNRAALRDASSSSATWVATHLVGVKEYRSKYELLSASILAASKIEGLYAEFGVYNGKTINHIASCVPDRAVHGFDSFEGLPEAWHTDLGKGAFSVANLPQVRTNVQLHKGWFSASLPPFAMEHSGPIAFMHVDADLYSSNKTIFEVFKLRIVSGTVIQFDEFFNYPGWRDGEYAAFNEMVSEMGLSFKYLGYCNGEQVTVQIT